MFALSCLTVFLAAVESPREVHVWGPWEAVLRPEDPVPAEVTLSVQFVGPSGRKITVAGFREGEAYRVRFFFPEPGEWKWRATSNPSARGLDGIEGSVKVTAYEGRNALYRHGYLRPSRDGRHLEHADGTPFFWLGDTAWSAPMTVTRSEWEAYLADRSAKGFSAVQIFCASRWAGEKDSSGNPPFLGKGLGAPNPAYWREYDEKVRLANEAGLVVLAVGVMEPVERYPEPDAARAFARYLAARLAGSFAILSPSFDSPYMPLGDAVGEAIREAAPHLLITQHPNTSLEAALGYADRAYLDFRGLQSGAGWGSSPLSPATASRNAIEWTLRLWKLTPPKPIVNLEARYDSKFNQRQIPRLPRSCGYLTLLSGAAGYTYGCAGVWNRGGSFVGTDPQAEGWEDWKTALGQESSADMKRLGEFFRSLEWWRLEPRPDLLADQPSEWEKKAALGCSPSGELAVAYLPVGDGLSIRIEGFPGTLSAEWFQPSTGRREPGPRDFRGAGVRRFEKPAGWEDAVLVLRSAPLR